MQVQGLKNEQDHQILDPITNQQMVFPLFSYFKKQGEPFSSSMRPLFLRINNRSMDVQIQQLSFLQKRRHSH